MHALNMQGCAGEKNVAPDAFYMNCLPFVEDLRRAAFPSFEAKPDLMPTEPQISAMAELIAEMGLSGAGSKLLILAC